MAFVFFVLNSEVIPATTDDRDKLGYLLYPLIHQRQPDIAAKLTGMLLEMENDHILQLIQSAALLDAYVNQAMTVLPEYRSGATAGSNGCGGGISTASVGSDGAEEETNTEPDEEMRVLFKGKENDDLTLFVRTPQAKLLTLDVTPPPTRSKTSSGISRRVRPWI